MRSVALTPGEDSFEVFLSFLEEDVVEEVHFFIADNPDAHHFFEDLIDVVIKPEIKVMLAR